MTDGVVSNSNESNMHMCHTEFIIDICTDSFPADEIFERFL
jgi:hypothetical protein